MLRLMIVFTVLVSFALAEDFSKCTVGVQGYDVVSYQTGKKPLRGNGNHIAVHKKVTYLFINKKNKETFETNPERYVPAYGGYCAYGVSVGKKFVGDPDVWKVVDKKLYLNLDTKIQGLWKKDVPGNIKKANTKWTEIQSVAPEKL
ncbi:YHS domain-containing (seleno)protein [Candidatus Uabimicrobium helgolandensis]